MRTRDGERELILVHLEVEARNRSRFEARMFEYYMLLRLRHGHRVFPIALVIARTPHGLDRPVHREGVLGDEVCAFRFWRIGLGGLDGASWLAKENPLAPALAAVMTPGSPVRAEWRLLCTRRIAQARVDDARRGLLLDFVETYLPLAGRELAQFENLLSRTENKDVRHMRKAWSEQLMEKAEKRGVELGEKRGVKLGEKLGEKRGEKRGVLRAKRETLLTQMRAKFGAVPQRTSRVVAQIGDTRRLDALLRRVLVAGSVDEMGLSR